MLQDWPNVHPINSSQLQSVAYKGHDTNTGILSAHLYNQIVQPGQIDLPSSGFTPIIHELQKIIATTLQHEFREIAPCQSAQELKYQR